MQKLRSVQILRFIASTMVVVSHATPLVVGAAGVDVFFVVSGFIIYRVSQGRTPGAFLRDRAMRVLPAYYLFSIPWILLATAAGLMTPAVIAATATLWPIFGDAVRPALKSGWSLSFEELFYLAAAASLAWPRLGRWLPFGWALALAVAVVTGNPLFRFLGNPLILEFFFGVMIAKRSFRSRPLGAAAIALAVAVFAWFAFHGSGDLDNQVGALRMEHPWRWLVWGVPGAALAWGVLQFEAAFEGRFWSACVYLGDASYSTYLTNLLVTLLIAKVLPGPITIVICLAVGVLGYRYVEQPLLRLLRRPRWPILAVLPT